MPGARPNVLLLLQDQLRADVTTADGISTPGMDRLRAEGLTFDQAYTPTGICSPARASLHTGLYAHTHGVLNNVTGPEAVSANLPRAVPTVAEMLRAAGYRTGHAGKWHVSLDDPPASRGFDVDVAGDGMVTGDDRFADYVERWAAPGATTVTTRFPAPGPRAARFQRRPFPMYSTDPVPVHGTLAAGVCEAGEAVLRSFATGPEANRPFFLVVSFVDPHWPNVLPEPWASMYDPSTIAPWSSFEDTFEGKPRTNQAGLEHFGVADFTWADWAPFVAHYLGGVTYADVHVQRLLGCLDELGLTDDTVVIASADHGDLAGSHRQFNKGPLMYEETYRVPLVVRWPGRVAPGSTSEGLASLVDLTPTIAEIATADPPADIHGRSLVPVLTGDTTSVRDALLCEFHGDELGLYSQRMIRRGSHKLVYNPNDLRELYDLSTDPAELHNLAYDQAHLTLRLDLEANLLELMDETADPLLRMSTNILG